jgi:molecular chaperone DnaK (HSP70)
MYRALVRRVMSRARYSIGIDLGTTNTALAFVPLHRAVPSEMLAVPQLESAIAIVEAPTLPSFLYLPDDAPARDALGADPASEHESESDAADERWVIGRLARTQSAQAAGRVVQSAKSWLAHHSADRSARFLPWGSDDIGPADKLSPVAAAALILRYLRNAWNDRFAAGDDPAPFEEQIVTITVPASFDAVAQNLTLAAARDAGYPQTVRLLEEPQAALYRWLEAHDHRSATLSGFERPGPGQRHVLVVDIGGGTSDFSLFAFAANGAGREPRIERIAVSEHILLGGDNMDLALAHRLEPELADDGEALSGRQWAYLVARCRDLKETALSTAGSAEDAFAVSIPGRGSRLIAQAKSARLTRAEIERLLLDGFFPACSAGEYPIRAHSALRELGLPYARDPAVTRHLADFLRERPPVDAVLFNGGALHSPRLRERIWTEITTWQGGVAPIVFENPEPDLAVARGAARFGKLVHVRAQRIEAGAAHAIFLHAARHSQSEPTADDRTLVCVLPHGAPTEQTFALADLNLELRVNVPVRFQTYSSARFAQASAGETVPWNDRDFTALPPLEIAVPAAHAARETLPVRLTSRVSELGRLELSCVSADARVPGTWPLEFNLRAENASARARRRTATSGTTSDAGPNAADDALAAARARITTLFERPINPRDKLTATRLLKSLETLLGAPKNVWNVVLVRSLWATLEQCMADRARSVDHEEAWLILAGFLLRPGFGAAMDDARIDRLWTLRETGRVYSAKTVAVAEYVMWRRVAGGLSEARQARVLGPDLARLLEQTNPPPELVLLAGSLERLDRATKAALIERFIVLASELDRERKHTAHVFAALGSLLNRAPFSGGPETVVAPEFVQRAFDAFARIDWGGPQRLELRTLFLRAARVVDNRAIDVSRSLRARIADKLEKAGVPAAKTAPLKDYLPLQRAERAGSFGESLPPGLMLREPVSRSDVDAAT